MDDVLPIEVTDPDLGALFLDVANHRYDRFNVRQVVGTELVPFMSVQSAGRNDPCPCGSGLKYKKCCLMAA